MGGTLPGFADAWLGGVHHCYGSSSNSSTFAVAFTQPFVSV
jgi:hypothetical protein